MRFIEAEKGNYPVTVLCRVEGVSRSGFYAWQSRPKSQRAAKKESLLKDITEAHRIGRGRYGSPRVQKHLRNAGQQVNRKQIARLMRENGIIGQGKRKFVVTTDSNHSLPVAPNTLAREFTVDAPNLVWVSDITYIPTHQGWLFLAVILDLYSRKVVGWSMNEKQPADLVLDALEMATQSRQVSPGLLFHSDRGCQYASADVQRVLRENKIVCSMSRKGNCWDNAVAESFFATLKKELVHDQHFATRDEARTAIFDFIQCFYNPVRLHSHLGYVSPERFESLNPQKAA